MTTVSVPKAEAARLLGVSLRTIDRRIKAGELRIERPTGGRHKTLVCLDNPRQIETSGDTERQLAAAQDLIKVLEDLVEFQREQLHTAQDHVGHLIQTLRDTTRALPAPAPEPEPRPWWKFWK